MISRRGRIHYRRVDCALFRKTKNAKTDLCLLNIILPVLFGLFFLQLQHPAVRGQVILVL